MARKFLKIGKQNYRFRKYVSNELKQELLTHKLRSTYYFRKANQDSWELFVSTNG